MRTNTHVRVKWASILYADEKKEPIRFYSIAWRLCLGDIRVEQPSAWPSVVRTQRRAYRHLCSKFTFEMKHANIKPTISEFKHPLQDVHKVGKVGKPDTSLSVQSEWTSKSFIR